MKSTSVSLITAAVLLTLTGTTRAELVSLDASGTPIMGLENLNTTANPDSNPDGYTYSTNGFAYTKNGSTAEITDGNTSTYDLTEYDGGYPTGDVFDSSYVGLSGVGLEAVTTATPVTELTVIFAISSSGYGGFFGNPEGYVSHSSLPSSVLVVPQLQITTDGTTWTTVAASSDYIDKLTGVEDDGPEVNSPVVTFTLATAASDIEGIRLIGTHSGRGTGDGFIGVSDLEVDAGNAPEPSIYAMLFGGLGMLVLVSRFRSKLTA
jgi:hypothetical protein